jgi:hypothetical protein
MDSHVPRLRLCHGYSPLLCCDDAVKQLSATLMHLLEDCSISTPYREGEDKSLEGAASDVAKDNSFQPFPPEAPRRAAR